MTNKVYVANYCGLCDPQGGGGTVTVINGATLSTTEVTVGTDPFSVAVNPSDQQDLRCKSMRRPTRILLWDARPGHRDDGDRH